MSIFGWLHRRSDTRLHVSAIDWSRPLTGTRAWQSWVTVPDAWKPEVRKAAEQIYAAHPRFSEDEAWRSAIGHLAAQHRHPVALHTDIDMSTIYRRGGAR